MTIVLAIGIPVVFLAGWFAAFMWGYAAGRLERRDEDAEEMHTFIRACAEIWAAEAEAAEAELAASQPPPTTGPQVRRGFGVSARTRRPGDQL